MSDAEIKTRRDSFSKTKEKVSEPPLYKVVLFNDDYTTKEFVVNVLVSVFNKTPDDAARLMWQIHRGGSGIAGVYPHEIAETKVKTVTRMARENGFPLQTAMEKE